MDVGKRGGRDWAAFLAFALRVEPQVRLAASRINRGRKVSNLSAPNRPCGNCPWRLDVAPGEFPVERYRALAPCAYDQSFVIFQCHKSTDEKPVACAGFLSVAATHNLAVRLAYSTKRLRVMDRSGGLALHRSFRSLAVANGVEPDNDVLRNCRA